MEILGKILGNQARVKIMRLLLQNRGKTFAKKEIVKRSRVDSSIAGRELNLLSSIGFVKKLSAGWIFNTSFKYGSQFEDLLINTDVLDKKAVEESFKKAGKIKLIIVSGVFIKNKDSRADLLVVGDKIKPKRIEEGVRRLEAEIGVELAYVVFDTKEFTYRLNMYDKLVRDILDFPHEVVFAGKELSTQTLKRA
jgi:hypothetical protein